MIGAAAWALGAHSQNYHQSFNGRKTVLVSAVAALADRSGTGDRQLLLPRRPGGALTVLEAFPLCPGVGPGGGHRLQHRVRCGRQRGRRRGGIGAIFSEAARWVASGAVWLIAQVGRAMSGTTSVDLDAGWFKAHEAVMASLAAAVVLPMACCAAIQAVYRQSASTLLRTFLVHLPLSLLLTGVAVTLVRMALAVTDAMSARGARRAPVSTRRTSSPGSSFLIAFGGGVSRRCRDSSSSSAASSWRWPRSSLWLELVVRAAAVSVAVLFLPLALAALVWPPIAHWCRRLADTLVALVLSKFVVAAVLSLAAGAGAGGLGVSSSGNGGGFASVVTGIASAPDRHPGAVHLAPVGAGGRSGSHRPSRVDATSTARAAWPLAVDSGRTWPLDTGQAGRDRSPTSGTDAVGTVGTASTAGSRAPR